MLRRFKMSVMVLALVDVLKRGNELRVVVLRVLALLGNEVGQTCEFVVCEVLRRAARIIIW